MADVGIFSAWEAGRSGLTAKLSMCRIGHRPKRPSAKMGMLTQSLKEVGDRAATLLLTAFSPKWQGTGDQVKSGKRLLPAFSVSQGRKLAYVPLS
jgi:hypothetical protein